MTASTSSDSSITVKSEATETVNTTTTTTSTILTTTGKQDVVITDSGDIIEQDVQNEDCQEELIEEQVVEEEVEHMGPTDMEDGNFINSFHEFISTFLWQPLILIIEAFHQLSILTMGLIRHTLS